MLLTNVLLSLSRLLRVAPRIDDSWFVSDSRLSIWRGEYMHMRIMRTLGQKSYLLQVPGLVSIYICGVKYNQTGRPAHLDWYPFIKYSYSLLFQSSLLDVSQCNDKFGPHALMMFMVTGNSITSLTSVVVLVQPSFVNPYIYLFIYFSNWKFGSLRVFLQGTFYKKSVAKKQKANKQTNKQGSNFLKNTQRETERLAYPCFQGCVNNWQRVLKITICNLQLTPSWI